MRVSEFLATSAPVSGIFLVPFNDRGKVCVVDRSEQSATKSEITSLVEANFEKIKRLLTYKRGGYRKLEPIDTLSLKYLKTVLFIVGETDENYLIAGFVIDPVGFIQVALRPKIQSISLEEMIIGVKTSSTDSLIFATENIDPGNLEQTKPVWILPGYSLGVALKGESIESIAKQRVTLNIVLIIIVSVVILVGGLLIFMTIKKEVELAQVKSDFISNVSHELRTPLALISMYAETLELDRIKSEDKKKEYYKTISQETNRLSRIVNGILNFSKMEAGKREFHFQDSDLNMVVEDVLDTYNFHLKNKGFKLLYEPSKNDLRTLLDAEAVSEAIINLLDNAVKYSGDSKTIELTTGEENGNAFVKVTDHGIGISPEDQKKIFEKFYRVSSGLVHNTKGTGLGLSLVNQIIHAHKGKVELVSSPGKGSTFVLKFPKRNLNS
jgi:two-component system phosphate regulon sensor histidine kinase PhoR